MNDLKLDGLTGKTIAEGCLGATLARLAEKYNIKKDDYWDFPKLVLTK